GSQVTLTCEAEGKPFPLLSWFRDGIFLQEEVGMTTFPILLTKVVPEDSGNYQCVAENPHGKHNQSFQLHVA
ncbi:SMP protein, partial [Bucco capensis]|nr:SMP protein [Bucco capensis]NXH16082.1 SMP protein [Bucco capensis]